MFRRREAEDEWETDVGLNEYKGVPVAYPTVGCGPASVFRSISLGGTCFGFGVLPGLAAFARVVA